MGTNRFLFAGGVFLAAFLLFLVEPMVGKQLLPVFGGAAAVWLTCLVYFQTALLVGYLFAHWMAAYSTDDRRARSIFLLYVTLLLLAAVASVVWAFGRGAPGYSGSHPAAGIFVVLTLSIGLPFIMLSATSPLFQAWAARLASEAVPYRLFALSNFASLIALALYPTLFEPHMTLRAQRVFWSCGFAAFAGLAMGVARQAARMASVRTALPAEAAVGDSSSPRTRLLWFLLPMAGAMQLSAVTSYLTANIAPIPLLWILPLAAYLVTLVVAFEYSRFISRPILVRLLAVMLAGLAYMLAKADVSLPARLTIGFFLIEMYLACLFCHTEAYALRPARSRSLTHFYLLFAAGGAVGSFFIGIACPLLFSANYDVALAFLATAAVAFLVAWTDGWMQRALWAVGIVSVLYVLVLLHAAYQRETMLTVRNFYASLRVKQSEDSHQHTIRTLSNGTIQHGTQIFEPTLVHTPTTYYAEDSGVGLALRYCCDQRARRIGVVGLGTGTLAAYGHAGDSMRFYEINPAVLPIAQHLFTYLRDSTAQISFVEGDARTSLSREASQHFDVLVIDAFSGDAIPLHLLTAEAMRIYQRQLAPDGVIAFHISNQHVDLEPAIALLANDAHMLARTVVSLPDDRRGEFNATWVLATNNARLLNRPELARDSHETTQRAGLRLWTDDYSSLLSLLR